LLLIEAINPGGQGDIGVIFLHDTSVNLIFFEMIRNKVVKEILIFIY